MADSDRCPICDEVVDQGVSERICESCGMSIPNDRPYFAVLGRGRYKTLCSSRCVTDYVSLGKTLLEIGR